MIYINQWITGAWAHFNSKIHLLLSKFAAQKQCSVDYYDDKQDIIEMMGNFV